MKVKVKFALLCPTLFDPMGYTVHGILQARILEWVAFPFSRGSSQPRDPSQVSHIAGRFFTSWATRGSPRILEWVACPFSSRSSQPSGIEPGSPALLVDSLPTIYHRSPRKSSDIYQRGEKKNYLSSEFSKIITRKINSVMY